MDDTATQLKEDRLPYFTSSISVRHIAETVDQPLTTIHKILQKMLRYYPYKLSLMLLLYALTDRQIFALSFLHDRNSKSNGSIIYYVNKQDPLSFGWRDQHVQQPYLRCRKLHWIFAKSVPFFACNAMVHFTATFILGPYLFEVRVLRK